MFASSHLQTALQLVKAYQGEKPFVQVTKQYFSTHKKHGSRDRKQILQLCYAYFRMGKALSGWTDGKRMLAGLFLGTVAQTPLLHSLQPDWNEYATASISQKAALLGFEPEELTIFPWIKALSVDIDSEVFSLSHLFQPDLFIRVRPGYAEEVEKKLQVSGVDFSMPFEQSVRLPNGFQVEQLFKVNREVVIQDLSSQKVVEFMKLLPSSLTKRSDFRIWDCCAASGGKSIMARDLFPSAGLTVSDIRSSILSNLRERFKEGDIRNYNWMVADLTKDELSIPEQHLVITDIPCTGSGTWSRTPEQLVFFDDRNIAVFQKLQQQILRNTIRKVLPGGYFLYITCSVFKAENEDNVDYILEHSDMNLVSMKVISGWNDQADTMFAALLHKAD